MKVLVLGERKALRLLVHRFLLQRIAQGERVVLMEGDNTFDPYYFGSFFRGESKSYLDRLLVARAFSAHQMARLCTRRLPKDTSSVVITQPFVLFSDRDLPFWERKALAERALEGMARIPAPLLVTSSIPVSATSGLHPFSRVLECCLEGERIRLTERGKLHGKDRGLLQLLDRPGKGRLEQVQEGLAQGG